MPYDFKKEKLYMPKNMPEIVTVPRVNYAAVRGSGDPNQEGGEYKQAISVLYAVSYTLRMSYKTDRKIEGFFEYVVPPLEGFWRQGDGEGFDYSRKSELSWISVIRLPDFIGEKDLEWAKETASRKKKIDCSAAEFFTVDEGLCVQMLHVGSYDGEPETVAAMDKFLSENGYANDMEKGRMHHEIYLSDPNKISTERLRTVLRHPIKGA